MKIERVEILLSVEFKDIDMKKENLTRAIERVVNDLIADLDHEGGVWSHINKIGHKIAFGDEGNFKFEKSLESVCDRCSKQDTLECTGNVKTFFRGVVVDCNGFKEKPED